MRVITLLNEIIDVQRPEKAVLTGIFLSDADLASIEDLLEPDDPNIGAAGRYRCVPVFAMTTEPAGDRAQYGNITYSYVLMDIID